MNIETKTLQDICDRIAAEIDAIVTVFGSRGKVIASSHKPRIGEFHKGVAAIMNGDLDSLSVTADEAAKSSTMFEGCASAIDFEGQRLFSVSVSAPLDVAQRYMRVVRYWILSHLETAKAQKLYDAAIRASEERFRDIAEVAGDWIWEMDDELRFTYLSERFFQIFTIAPETIIGKTRHEFAGRAMESPEWLAHYRELNARKPFRSFEYDANFSEDKTGVFKISGKPIFSPSGAFRGYRGTGTDITELRLREQQRDTERERLRRVMIEVSEKNSMLESLSGKLSRYLPPQVYATIFSGAQDVKVVSQRKKLTVFFSDIVGFTETTDKLESEDLTQLLNEYLTEMSRIAQDYGGTIDKYIGDAVMIFFGDPESRGVAEDAIACVRMASAMQRRIRELAARWQDMGIERPLTARMGIHTGYCTVGNFGSDDRVSYTAVGGGVNLASRLESEAAPGGILISYETYACVRDEIRCEEAGKIAVKGLAYPVTTYRVTENFDNAAESGVLRVRLPNLALNLDPGQMTAEEQNKARDVLERALERLRIPPVSVPASMKD